MTGSRQPNAIDVHVGARIRLRRQLMKMSQEKLGKELGVTFQQVQKYERGTNRVGASRLWRLSHVLDVPIPYFFKGLDNARSDATDVDDLMLRTISSHDGPKFIEALDRIVSGDTRRQLLSLMRVMAGQSSDDRESRSEDS